MSNIKVMAVLRARRMVCTARSAASRPWLGSPNSSWHSENNATYAVTRAGVFSSISRYTALRTSASMS